MWPFSQPDRIGADGKRLGASLLSLEVNTIISEGITAESMPVMPHALLDIAVEYIQAMLALDLPVAELDAWLKMPPPVRLATPPPPLAQPRDAETIVAELPPNIDTFARLRCAAITLQVNLDSWERAQPASGMRDRSAADRREANRRLAMRMVNNIEILLGFLKRITDDELIRHLQFTRMQLAQKHDPDDRSKLLHLGPYTLPPSEFLAVRKVWEIGTAEIVAQTVIALDGDVVTRLTPAVVRGDGAAITALHQQGVNTSLAYWNALVTTLLTVVGQALGTIFRR
jgi:hypothetical protein